MERTSVTSGGTICVLLTLWLPSAFAAVGRTPGAPGVSATGESSYAIAFSLPPGTRGLTPQLGLVYSSGVGQSIAGVGWSIAGLSAITRCASTVAQDGVARNVRNDLQDRFCLDGRKLRLVAGSYGVAGSEYRTELESYARITANGTAGNGPAWFKVERADGLIYEYGNSADSRIESVGQATARAWAVNRIRDRQGNEILFSYAEDTTNGSYRVDLVSYAGNPDRGVAAPYSVDFVYQTKPVGEIDSGYLAGSKIKELTRLDRVDVLHGGSTLVRRWELTYEAALSSTGRSRLASVQECAGSPLDCLAPSSFSYQNGSLGLGPVVNTGVPIPAGLQTIDVDGDGRQDLVYSSSATSGSGTWRVMFATAAGGFAAPIDTGVLNTNYTGAIPIDYNADGKADLLVPYAGNTWWVLLGSSSGLAAR